MFNGFFKFGRGAGIVYPPVSEDLLVWLKGNDNETDLKLDSWLKPDAENWAMSGAYCASLNGTDEYGTLGSGIVLKAGLPTIFRCEFDCLDSQTVVDTLPDAGNGIGNYINFRSDGRCFVRFGDETVNEIFWSTGGFLDYEIGVEYVFSLTVEENGDFELLQNDLVWISGSTQYVPDGVSEVACEFGKSLSSNYFCGKLYDVTISEKHFRIAEGPGDGTNLTSFSDDYQTDGMSIAWTADAGTLWAQRQDTYFGNVLAPGWWEITGDDVLYPYPVVGFDTHHEGGTFNSCEVSYEPESKPAGTMNGTDTEIVFDNAVPVGATMTFGGTATAVLDVGNSKITDAVGGTIRNIQIMDGAEVWAYLAVDEGTGLIFADSSGNDNGARTTDDPVAFWAGAPMVSQAVGDAEAAADVPYFTDGNYHPVAKNQQEWENDLNDDWQRYFCPKVGMWFYKTKRDEAGHLENVEFMYKQCDQLYEALYDEVSGEIGYDEVSLKILYNEET